MKVKTTLGAAVLLASLGVTHALAQPVTIPEELAGVWSTNDKEGQEWCASYRKNPEPGENGYFGLIGNYVFSDRMIHRYSDMGEGDFYIPRAVQIAGKNGWQIEGRVYGDSYPSDDEGNPIIVKGDPEDDEGHDFSGEFSFESEQLRWTDIDAEGKRVTTIFFKCGQLPKDYGKPVG